MCSLIVCPSGCFHLNIWHSFKIFKSYFPLDFTKGNYWFLLLFFKNYFLAKDHLIWFVYVRPYELTSRGTYDCDSYKDTQIYIQNSLDFLPKSIENIRLIGWSQQKCVFLMSSENPTTKSNLCLFMFFARKWHKNAQWKTN